MEAVPKRLTVRILAHILRSATPRVPIWLAFSAGFSRNIGSATDRERSYRAREGKTPVNAGTPRLAPDVDPREPMPRKRPTGTLERPEISLPDGPPSRLQYLWIR